MVLLKITPKIHAAIQKAQELNLLDALSRVESEPELENAQIGAPITYGQIIDISKVLEEHASEDVPVGEFTLGELLRGSEVYVEPKAKSGSKEEDYNELMARLRREEEDRAYERMLSDQAERTPNPVLRSVRHKIPLTKTTQEQQTAEGDEVTYSDVNRQLILVFNVIVTVVACGAGIWLVASRWNTTARLALSMSGALVIGVAEVVIYMGYLRRLQEAKQKERSKSERKVIVDTWVISGKDKKSSSEELVALESVEKQDNTTRKRRGKR